MVLFLWAGFFFFRGLSSVRNPKTEESQLNLNIVQKRATEVAERLGDPPSEELLEELNFSLWIGGKSGLRKIQMCIEGGHCKQ